MDIIVHMKNQSLLWFQTQPFNEEELKGLKKNSQNRKTLSMFVIAIETMTHLQRLEIKGSKLCNKFVTICVPHQILETIAEEV